jgi:hypothetical protein
MQRTIEIADFELPRGPIRIAHLVEQPEALWGHLRNEITRQRLRTPNNPLARCRLCKGSIYITSRVIEGIRRPLFAHYSEAPKDCPWHSGAPMTPDAARAAQYQGLQESAHHRWLCETIGSLLKRDPRCRVVTVETYLRPAIHQRGRYPDVYAEIDDLGKFAIEVQLAKPLATEIAARHLHYEVEGVSLIWVFDRLADPLPQGFADVICLQRGNAFLFDEDALTASGEQDRLRLSCFLDTDKGGWLQPRIVSLDQLDHSTGRAVFLEDRRTNRLIDFCKAGRVKWWPALRQIDDGDFEKAFTEKAFLPAWDSVSHFVPQLLDWKRTLWSEESHRGDRLFCELAAILFSIAHSAQGGSPQIYVSRYKGEGRLIAMLNAKLSGQSFKPYATLIEVMLEGTKARDSLERMTLRAALDGAKKSTVQIGPHDAVWAGVCRLFPEVFDRLMRAELEDLGNLPDWAR